MDASIYLHGEWLLEKIIHSKEGGGLKSHDTHNKQIEVIILVNKEQTTQE